MALLVAGLGLLAASLVEPETDFLEGGVAVRGPQWNYDPRSLLKDLPPLDAVRKPRSGEDPEYAVRENKVVPLDTPGAKTVVMKWSYKNWVRHMIRRVVGLWLETNGKGGSPKPAAVRLRNVWEDTDFLFGGVDITRDIRMIKFSRVLEGQEAYYHCEENDDYKTNNEILDELLKKVWDAIPDQWANMVMEKRADYDGKFAEGEQPNEFCGRARDFEGMPPGLARLIALFANFNDDEIKLQGKVFAREPLMNFVQRHLKHARDCSCRSGCNPRRFDKRRDETIIRDWAAIYRIPDAVPPLSENPESVLDGNIFDGLSVAASDAGSDAESVAASDAGSVAASDAASDADTDAGADAGSDSDADADIGAFGEMFDDEAASTGLLPNEALEESSVVGDVEDLGN